VGGPTLNVTQTSTDDDYEPERIVGWYSSDKATAYGEGTRWDGNMVETKKSDAGQAEVQAKFDEAEEQGYFGTDPDSTPNDNYTLSGVTSGKPTPENQRGKS
jgi:hypothetical protein